MPAAEDNSRNVVFLHPDLGIGGAERAIVDAALALQHLKYNVKIVTNHHDPSHCFEETRDGTLDVVTVASWLPRSIFGRAIAFCAYYRMVIAAFYLVFFSKMKPDLVFVDQVSAPIPLLRLCGYKVIFYCHYPDKLLSDHSGTLKRLYRIPLDWLEEWSTLAADKILVNSKFTAGVFMDAFRSARVEPGVLYPVPVFKPASDEPSPQIAELQQHTNLFVSINRYERKKNIMLAVEALQRLRTLNEEHFSNIHLVIAGGYDTRLSENVDYHTELLSTAQRLGVADSITFIRNISYADKVWVLENATALLYTPDKEHFGIVPVEAMYYGCPVIAVASGGPLETVVDNETGYLLEQTPERFAATMNIFATNPKLRKRLSAAAKKRVESNFSTAAYRRDISKILKVMF